jgi:hypothetical protein
MFLWFARFKCFWVAEGLKMERSRSLLWPKEGVLFFVFSWYVGGG